jgi:hypothetical protein
VTSGLQDVGCEPIPDVGVHPVPGRGAKTKANGSPVGAQSSKRVWTTSTSKAARLARAAAARARLGSRQVLRNRLLWRRVWCR